MVQIFSDKKSRVGIKPVKSKSWKNVFGKSSGDAMRSYVGKTSGGRKEFRPEPSQMQWKDNTEDEVQ